MPIYTDRYPYVNRAGHRSENEFSVAFQSHKIDPIIAHCLHSRSILGYEGYWTWEMRDILYPMKMKVNRPVAGFFVCGMKDRFGND